MSMLAATGLAQSFGAVDIFSGISVTIPNDGKIGLVGPNGIGKTTLLLILAGRAVPSSGSVTLAKGTRVGYLPQEAVQAFVAREHSVYEEMLTVFSELRAKERDLRAVEAQMEDQELTDALFERYSRLHEAFELAGGYSYVTRIKQVLTGLGFPEERWQLPLTHLSGGQKTRVLLAKLLLEKPDLLILDEPTNHLDVGAIEWLEGALRIWDGAVLIVSHDRYFLDQSVQTIWEMGRTGMEVYRGNYSAYVTQRESRWQRREQEYEALQERLAKEMDYIRRNIAGQRTQMAKGKLSRIAREVEAIHAAGYAEVQSKSWSRIAADYALGNVNLSVGEVYERIKQLPRPAHRPVRPNFRLQPTHRSGNIVLRAKRLVVGYPNVRLFEAPNLELHRGECAALIGPNGTGKSSLLKTLLGDLPPLAGEFRLGASLEMGYFAQAHDALNLENTVLDELLRHQFMQTSAARSYLAQYLFRGDEVFQPVHTLSGGERGRLALAVLALTGANFLLLDEPTNHLDIAAQEVLEDGLKGFPGTILLVSHDRYLISRLATQIWELRDGQLVVFKGSYDAFVAAREAAAEQARMEKAELAEAALAEAAAAQPSSNGAPGGSPLSKNEQRRRQAALERTLLEIEQAEQKLEAVSEAIQRASAAQEIDKIQRLSIEYEAVAASLHQLIEAWETLSGEHS